MLIADAILHASVPIVFSMITGALLIALNERMPLKNDEPEYKPSSLLWTMIYAYCYWLAYPLLPNEFSNVIGLSMIVGCLLWFAVKWEVGSFLTAILSWNSVFLCCNQSTSATAVQIIFQFCLVNFIWYLCYHARKNEDQQSGTAINLLDVMVKDVKPPRKRE